MNMHALLDILQALGIHSKSKPLLPVTDGVLLSHKLPDSELLQLTILCDGDETVNTGCHDGDLIPAGIEQSDSTEDAAAEIAAAEEVLTEAAAAAAPACQHLQASTATDSCSSSLQQPATPTTEVGSGQQAAELVDHVAECGRAVTPKSPTAAAAACSQVTSAAAEAAAARSAAAHAGGGLSVPWLGSLLEVSDDDKAAVAARAAVARQKVDEVFSDVDAEQQRQVGS